MVHAIDELFPAGVGDTDPGGPESSLPMPELRDEARVRAADDGYLQLIDADRLLAMATRRDLVVAMARRPGDYRTLTQDAEFGFLQLVEVGVRALSPGINDPFTAMTCIERPSSLLRRLAERPFPSRHRYDDAGDLRMIMDTTSFEGFVDTSYDQIRQNARGSVAVLVRLLEGIERVLPGTRSESRRLALLGHGDLVIRAAEDAGVTPRDMRDLVERRAALDRTSSAVMLGDD